MLQFFKIISIALLLLTSNGALASPAGVHGDDHAGAKVGGPPPEPSPNTTTAVPPITTVAPTNTTIAPNVTTPVPTTPPTTTTTLAPTTAKTTTTTTSTTTDKPITTTHTPDTSPATSSTAAPDVTTTHQPPGPTPNPGKHDFSGWSFLLGVVATVCIIGLSMGSYKFYKIKTDRSYRTL